MTRSPGPLVVLLAASFSLAAAVVHSAETPAFDGPKIVLSLQPRGDGRACEGYPGSLCNDGKVATNTVIQGDLITGYDAYLVVVDVFPKTGLTAVTLGVDYPGDQMSVSWEGCADHLDGEDWPSPGAGATLSFDLCQGDAEDPMDPEGDASVVLGAFYVYAYSPSSLVVRPQDEAIPNPWLTDCGGSDETIFHTGAVGFGGVAGVDPCANVIVEGCQSGFVPYQYFCCADESNCVGETAGVSGRACGFQGGTWVHQPCSAGLIGCNQACRGTAAERMTWTGIKLRH